MIPAYPVETDIPLEAQGTWPLSVHSLSAKAATALRAAEAVGRPLLIRGEPGVGKSQTARAAAAFARRPFLSVTIDGRTEPHDLMWRFDAVRRLADAQAAKEGDTLPDELHYVEPRALWWAYNWKGATLQNGGEQPCERPKGWDPKTGRAVLLIDEIDKADPDLPNALLEVLANKGFRLPYKGGEVTCTDANRPLIVMTTNEERELPNAFLRRCMVLTLELDRDHERLAGYLIDIARRHQDFLIARRERQGRCRLLEEIAELVGPARDEARRRGDYLPGTSEYLDLVGILAQLHPDDESAQRSALGDLSSFALQKSAARG